MNNITFCKVFTPGRLCLLGEHTDWVALISKDNYGQAIICNLNLGIYLRGCKSNQFFYKFGRKSIHSDTDNLKNYINDDFFSYVIATFYVLSNRYSIPGVYIDCYKMTLPMKKGLSSSAAICVAIIDLCSKIYNLKIPLKLQMELAFEAEILTGSKCGKMDQCCALGTGIYDLKFYDDNIDINPIHVPSKLIFVLVDLNGNKNTTKILSDLNRAYVGDKGVLNNSIKQFLNQISNCYVDQVIESLKSNDIKTVGQLLNAYQMLFDEHLTQYCDELKAPLLHNFIDCMKHHSDVLACKGVGSQGDGFAQILLTDKNKAREIIQFVKQKYGYQCYLITSE